MKHLKTQKQLNEASENLNISDVMKHINSLMDELNDINKELDKSEDEMERLINDGWDYIKFVGRKNTIEKAFDVIGIKYVS
jgi:hypothetical protein